MGIMTIVIIVIYTDKKYTKLTTLPTIEWIVMVTIQPLWSWVMRPYNLLYKEVIK